MAAASSLLRRSKQWAKMSILSPTLRSKPATSSSSSSFLSTGCSAQALKAFTVPSQAPPVPKKIPVTVSAHGMTWRDPYRWMRNSDDPDFFHLLERENSYAQAFMADSETLRRKLAAEMKARLSTSVSTPPERWGPWLYRQYIPEGKEYPVLCRSMEDGEVGWFTNLFRRTQGEEQVLLDWNQIAEQYGYVHVGVCRVSPDHNYLAYTVDPTGEERFVLQIKDLRNGHLVPRSEINGVVSLAWAQDGKTLFYTLVDENQRPHRVLCTHVGSEGIADAQVFMENDSSFCVDITSTKDGKFVTVNSNSRTSSEVYVIDADKPLAGLRRTRKRVPGVQYFLEHNNGFFYILTNAPIKANNEWSESSDKGYYLARCQVEDIEASEWQTIICRDEDVSLQDMDMFNDHMVLFLSKKGLPMLCSIDMPIKVDLKHPVGIENLNPWFFPLPSNPCSVVPGSNQDFLSSVYRAVLSSPVTPDIIVDFDMSRRSFSIVQREDIIGDSGNTASPCSMAFSLDGCSQLNSQTSKDGDDQGTEMHSWNDSSDAYVCDRQEVSSHDGVEVPLTILYSRRTWQKGHSPGILIGYGAYGEVLDKSWCLNRLSLLDRGWVVAFADVRGGGGGDLSWHRSGTGLSKQNSIRDFLSCANYLVNEGYVHRHHLGAIGYSAGCILPAAAINMHPTLFRAVILKVPFLDVLNTLMDPSLPLTILDYEEFGNPQIQTVFKSILSYSPYNNILHDVCYPSMLITTSFHDPRVGPWEGAKWVAKVRDSTCSRCARAVILRTNMAGGHFGEGGRYAQCEETAFDYAFLMKVMGHSLAE